MDVNVVSLPTTVPWAAIIGAATTLLVLVATLLFNYFSIAQRLNHERTMKLREDRQKAYATMARITKSMEVSNPRDIKDLAETQSEIEMLTEEGPVLDAAEQLLHAAIKARQATARKDATPTHPLLRREFEEAKEELDECRTAFINLARAELERGPRPSSPKEEVEQEMERNENNSSSS